MGWFRLGFLGVDIFFAISGAVIVLSIASLMQRYGSQWRWEFVRRRLARIVPLYLLTGVLFVCIVNPGMVHGDVFKRQVLSHLLFVQNLSPSTIGVINGPSWTLAIEKQFYVLALLAAGWLVAGRKLTIGVAALVAAALWRGFAMYASARDSTLPMTFLHLQLPGLIDGFLVGAVVARWHLDHMPTASARLALVLGVAALVLWALALTTMVVHMHDYWLNPISVIAVHTFVALACAAMVAAAMRLPPPARGRPLLRLSGNLSYGIYLWHLGIVLWLLQTFPQLTPHENAAATIGMTLVLAGLSWTLVEQPVLRWSHRSRLAPVRA